MVRTTPPTIFRHDLATGQTALWRQPRVKFSPADYEVKQIFYASKDGTRVPMFISHKKGLKQGGDKTTTGAARVGYNESGPFREVIWTKDHLIRS